MRKWVTMLLLGLLFLSGFHTVKAEATQTTSQVQTSCQDCSCIDVNVLLSNLTANITNLTNTIGQKRLKLKTLYGEWSVTKNTSVLFEIVKLKDEIRLLTNELKYLERQKLSLQLAQNYTVQTPYGKKILYYKLPSESTIVQEHIKKVHPVRTDVDLEWFIAYYRQAAELTFTEVVQTDMRMRELLKKVEAGNYTDDTISEIFTLLDKREKLWNEIYRFTEEKEKLQTIQTLRETGRKQILIASATGVEPLAINFGGIAQGDSCSESICMDAYGLAPPLPGVFNKAYASSAPVVHYTYISPVAVWVGIYESSIPNKDYYWGQYCTYDFPKSSTDFKKYWDRAVQLYPALPDIGGSMEIKLFYRGWAYNTNSNPVPHSTAGMSTGSSNGRFQESNLIWQVECNKNGCWVVSYYQLPLSNPGTSHSDIYVRLYINFQWLRDRCCKGGDVGNMCKWANGHCGGCFAPDESASQNFPIVDRNTWQYIVRW
ncbi:hypothetical protein [Thermococcus sp. 21S7]|uniref:hypothetical protein n=1 Tax=Thermococcus sp. 21S7 TaxID=1638221 RepID=UPI001438B586|nr:hypothetical protein [Thermococcus sp. 21S7]NJE61419.1 hypothetical protein [Thermococcus sp. 21S7]